MIPLYESYMYYGAGGKYICSPLYNVGIKLSLSALTFERIKVDGSDKIYVRLLKSDFYSQCF